MKKYGRFFRLLSLLLLFACGCGKTFAVLSEDISLSLQEKRIQDFSISGLTLVFYIRVENKTSDPYEITRYDYKFFISKKEYIQMETTPVKPMHVPAHDTSLLAFPLKITYSRLFENFPELKEQDTAYSYLVGGFVVSKDGKEKGRIPFSYPGEFPIFKAPEIEFLDLQVKDLTIGGADILFNVRFNNPNAFDLFILRIIYNLKLGGHDLGNGRIKGDKDMKPQEIKEYSLPLLLNFFEVGKKVYGILHQDSFPGRFTGEIFIKTIWGFITVPFDKSGEVSITRVR
ncbi:MAG: LEA type 2 family protein [Candidatus Aminicenantes bacterium]|nr:LEA type 2 family protein [Candidatus Aminicenantes bacterium]